MSGPEDENLIFCKQSHKKTKLLTKMEKKSIENLQIKIELISSSIFIKEEDIKSKLKA